MHFKNKPIMLLILGVFCILCSCREQTANSIDREISIPPVTGNFYISILDIGKADAVILYSGNSTAIIDCGEKGDGKDILEYLSKKNIQYIDYLFITHFDKDHVGGAAKLISNINIGKIITPQYNGSNEEYAEYIKTVKAENIIPAELTDEMIFTLNDVLFEVFPPQKAVYKEGDNDYSLVISVSHGENKFLFAGDAEEERLSELWGQLILKHDFLKVPHHGRLNSNTKRFLENVNPQYAVITCSEKNPPDNRVIDILNGLNSSVYLTKDGNVEAVSDGERIIVNQ